MFVLNSIQFGDVHADRVHRPKWIAGPSNVILLSMSLKVSTNTNLAVNVQKKYVERFDLENHPF